MQFGQQVNVGVNSLPPDYVTDYKFGFDFGYWSKLINGRVIIILMFNCLQAQRDFEIVNAALW